ncbi:hypothetical protein [Rubellicoccus peritrichatus]|uniref:Uncharacterized protein n=1 Tax=Rubellicoccus peritrichatus TaxID=3080537 RepID=A0AAQ3QT99_9BACT|nr:hypothetical protein [Puniceicoccus sp. CR14]WOO43478.1 hypothetical protein RZN69_10290 [Puniceicoccus sp. CR14]
MLFSLHRSIALRYLCSPVPVPATNLGGTEGEDTQASGDGSRFGDGASGNWTAVHLVSPFEDGLRIEPEYGITSARNGFQG